MLQNCALCFQLQKLRDFWEPFIKEFLYDSVATPLVYTQVLFVLFGLLGLRF